MSLKPWWKYPAYDDPKYDTIPPPGKLETRRPEQALDEDHLTTYIRAIRNVLSTKLAESTFAQTVDGLPLWDVVYSLGYYGLDREEPVFKHRELCPGVVEKTRAFRADFDPKTFDIRAELKKYRRSQLALQHSNPCLQVLLRYQSAPLDSRVSQLALVELIAVTVHAIAAHVFKQVDAGLHKMRSTPAMSTTECSWRRKKSTPFSLWRYDDPKQYPDGNADIAAHWAEDQIFGGIVLFGRGESGNAVCSLHSGAIFKGIG